MRLIDLLEIIPDYLNVYMYNRCDEEIAEYNNRESIPDYINTTTPTKIEPITTNSVKIYID